MFDHLINRDLGLEEEKRGGGGDVNVNSENCNSVEEVCSHLPAFQQLVCGIHMIPPSANNT